MTTTAPGTSPAASGLREQRKRRTTEDLQRVARELFAARGFDAVTVDDIAAAAAVSKTTFYRYFDSKEDVLLGTATQRLEGMRAALQARTDEPTFDAIRNAFLTVAERFELERERNIAVGRIMRTTPSLAARNLEHQAAWEAVVRDFLAERDGVPTPGLRHYVLAANVVASMRAATDFWITNDAPAGLPAFFEEALRVSLRDVRGPCS